MSNRSQHPGSPELEPVIMVGGLLSFQAQAPFYDPILDSPSSTLPNSERFLPIPSAGLAPFDEMLGTLSDQLTDLYEKLESRVVLGGHSLGGLMVTALGLEHPDKVSDVFCLAGVQDGIQGETKAATLLRLALGNPSHAKDLQADSDFMTSHRERIAAKWPQNTSLHLVVPTWDCLIPVPRGLDVSLPGDRQPGRRYVSPVNRSFAGTPDAERLGGVAGHITIARTRSVINYVREIRGAEVLQPINKPAVVPAAAYVA